MRRICLLLIVLCLLFTTNHAQEKVKYRLRTAPVEEFLAVIPTIVQASSAEYGEQNTGNEVIREIEFLAKNFYPVLANQDANLLYEAYQAILSGGFWFDDREVWFQSILIAWLRDHPAELKSEDHYQIFEFELIVRASFDFNRDNQMDWIIEVQSSSLRNFYLLTSENNLYHFIATPLSWFADGFSYWMPAGGASAILGYSDLNKNGFLEWQVVTGCMGSGGINYGKLYILEWRENRIVDLTSYSGSRAMNSLDYETPAGGCDPIPASVVWHFLNIDNDLADEIRKYQELTDNWGCDLLKTSLFDWHEAEYRLVFIEQTVEFADSAGCALRQAQDQLWAGNYMQAIPPLEKSVAQYTAVDLSSLASYQQDYYAPQIQVFKGYAVARLALAYSMVGRSMDAANLINQTSVPEIEPAKTLLHTLKAADFTNPEAVCRQMYEVFEAYYQGESPWLFWGVTQDLMGNSFGINKYYGVSDSPSALPKLERSGCDFPAIYGNASTPVATPTYVPAPTSTLQTPSMFDAINLYQVGDYSNAITILESLTPAINPLAFSYYRGVILEKLNRQNEALAEYIAIYETAPDSTWGMLAALHLEPID